MKEKLKIGFITATNPLDRRSSSGVHYRMFQALSQEFEEVVALGPLSISKPVWWVLRVIGFLHLKLFKKAHNTWHSPILSKHYAKQIEKKLAIEKPDILIAPKASTEIAYLKTEIPIIYTSDTSFDQIKNYYHHYSNFSDDSIKESNSIEQRAINNSKYQVYCSAWAANHVISFYKANPKNVFIVKHAANLDEAPPQYKLKRNFINPIKLVFVGIEWERKGGDIAFEAFKKLLEQGYDVTFTVCGCVPPVTHPRMTVIPFLNKNNEQDRIAFDKLLLESHLFFMPTRAECFGIAFCEANAYGLPVITTDTGGVTSIVENGVNGYALPIDAKGQEYAAIIKTLLDAPQKIEEMSANARKKYENELNWAIWGKQIKELILRLSTEGGNRKYF